MISQDDGSEARVILMNFRQLWISCRVGSRPVRRTGLRAVLALAVLALLGGPTPARAQLLLSVQDDTAPAGGMGAFDVVLTDIGGTFQIAGFSIELLVPPTSPGGPSGVQFTAADTN